MPGAIRLLGAAACALLLLWGGAAHAARILFIVDGPVQPGMFVKLAEVGQPLGIQVEARFAQHLPAEVAAADLAGHDLILLQAPRPQQRVALRTRLAGALGSLQTPTLWLQKAGPEWRGLPEPLARRLLAYYVNGGRANFEGFLQTLAAHFSGKPWQGIRDPVVFPEFGLYHPDYPGQVFPETADYLKWKGVDPAGAASARPPIIAIALHQNYIAAEQTAFIDALIARIEATGALPLPFYGLMMEPDSVGRMVTVAGKPVADVIINTQIMMNPEGRRQEFDALGLPVIQAMPYRRGDEAAWRADPHGISQMDIPFYMAHAEYAGVTDIQVAAATRRSDDQVTPIDAQVAAVVDKALNLVKLQRLAPADKKVAVFFWNYPPGEKNLTASYMNVPRSLVATLAAMKQAGYTTETPGELELTLRLQRLLSPYYQPAGDRRELEALLREGLAERLPVAVYRDWLKTLQAAVREALQERWGEPEESAMVIHQDGAAWFVVPRLQLGKLSLLPQAPRGERWEDKEKALYHSTNEVPSHFYLASYLWARQQFGAHALVHYGTHGTQEWLPGKERGLSVSDYPMLAVGNIPVVYPYIVDNIGESTQAKRRGRATIISHQTPPFAPAGLYEALTRIHDRLHAWQAQGEGAVKDKIKAEFLAGVRKERIDKDLGWSVERIEKEFPAFVTQVHDHLHELARTAQPMGLHTFGRGPEEKWRLATVLMMLGQPFWESVAGPGEEADEMLVGDYTRLTESTPYRFLRKHVLEGASAADLAPDAREAVEKAKGWYRALGADNELAAFLAALAGRHIPTTYGGDPIKNPDTLPTGRNIYGFDPSRVPTQPAWEAGKEALENLLAAHRRQSGKTPRKLAFSLWSVETMRHLGLLEAQALWALGVEPVWDAGGRVTDVKLVPREKLGRPRVDVVLSATGLYRDHFPNVMKRLAKAVQLAAEADEADNPVAENTRRIARSLVAKGLSPEAAQRAGQTRIFASESGKYGTGVNHAALVTDTWKGKKEGDRKLAALYLSRMQFAYGPDEAEWGQKGQTGNLYAEHLKGTEGAVLSRTSNLFGMLTTDDPFQYLGGIALAVRHLDGKAPELYISNLRGSGSGKVEGAAQFLSKELATRNFHPGYIQGLIAEGYAGTLDVLDSMNNFWGWTAVAREIVRDDQWQEFVDVYVRDKHRLGLKEWFEGKNPHALAQTMERMLEAVRQGYWQADARTVAELKERYRDLAARYQVKTDNATFRSFVNAGFGFQGAAPAKPSPTRPQQAADLVEPEPAPPPIQGMQLEKAEPPKPAALTGLAVVAALLLLAFLGGAGRGLTRRG
ncbi:MAG: cobaltochelatase subunit CobN [Rhodocyclaceae bacterium]|nr:cobaltochelatase subunit CobN [Rhodocyclaceae bacterium]